MTQGRNQIYIILHEFFIYFHPLNFLKSLLLITFFWFELARFQPDGRSPAKILYDSKPDSDLTMEALPKILLFQA